MGVIVLLCYYVVIMGDIVLLCGYCGCYCAYYHGALSYVAGLSVVLYAGTIVHLCMCVTHMASHACTSAVMGQALGRSWHCGSVLRQP